MATPVDTIQHFDQRLNEMRKPVERLSVHWLWLTSKISWWHFNKPRCARRWLAMSSKVCKRRIPSWTRFRSLWLSIFRTARRISAWQRRQASSVEDSVYLRKFHTNLQFYEIRSVSVPPVCRSSIGTLGTKDNTSVQGNRSCHLYEAGEDAGVIPHVF
jgi:hypothetical protein